MQITLIDESSTQRNTIQPHRSAECVDPFLKFRADAPFGVRPANFDSNHGADEQCHNCLALLRKRVLVQYQCGKVLDQALMRDEVGRRRGFRSSSCNQVGRGIIA